MSKQNLLFQNSESETLSPKQENLSWEDLRGLSWMFLEDESFDESFKAKIACA